MNAPQNHPEVKAASEMRRQLACDPHRPQYHFQSPANWINDANGCIFWRGEYHLFYQYNPNGPFHGTIHWGHAVSRDLVHWSDLPVALKPDTPYDKDGVWSGNAVIDDRGIPTAIYTGRSGNDTYGVLATSADGMLTWQKHPEPVLARPPFPGTPTHWDAQIWKDGDTWYQLVGGKAEGRGTAVLYRSPDLLHWTYAGRIYTAEDEAHGTFWELPYLLPFGERHVLIVGVHPVPYYVGTYDREKHIFTPEKEGILDYGTRIYYAPNPSMVDANGPGGAVRRIMWAWVMESEGSPAPVNGWAGMLSIPRILSLLPDGALSQEPAPELRILRRNHRRLADVEITPDSAGLLPEVQGMSLEIIAEFDLSRCTASDWGLVLRRWPGREEETLLRYNRPAHLLVVDRSRSSRLPGLDLSPREGPLSLGADKTLRLHAFLDHSVVEVFANGRTAITGRIYPSRADSLGVDLFALGGSARLKSLDAWELGSIW